MASSKINLKHLPCNWDHCSRGHIARGYCAAHYVKAKKIGLIQRLPNKYLNGCIENSCGKRLRANGLCAMHYQRKLRSNDEVKRMEAFRSLRWKKTFRGRYSTLLRSAKVRGIPVELDFSKWTEIVQAECYYCSDFFKRQNEYGSSIDRVDNKKGYTVRNSVSCCAFCNRLKGDLIEYDEMRFIIENLIKFRIGREVGCGQ